MGGGLWIGLKVLGGVVENSVWEKVELVRQTLRTISVPLGEEEIAQIEICASNIAQTEGWSDLVRCQVIALIAGGATEDNWQTTHVPF